jgi:hypothetical protein
MPDTAAPQQPPAVESPRHPLDALTTFELTRYRRELERAIAFFDAQDRVPPVRADLQARLDAVLVEEDVRGRMATRA